MKKNINLMSFIFVLCISTLASCDFNFNSGNSSSTTSETPDYSKKTGKLGFMTYSVPLPTEEQFRLFTEAGLRTMLMSGEYLGFYQKKVDNRDAVDTQTLEQFFSLAEEFNVGILDFSMDIASIIGNKNRLALYEKYPNAFEGFFISDEPGVKGIDDIAKRNDWVNENYPGATYTTTLHPSWAPVETELDEGQGKVSNIQEYYEYFIDEVLNDMSGKKILCADDYPCKRYGYDGENFLETLMYMSLACYDNPRIIKQMCLNCSTFREVNEAPGESARPQSEWQGAYEKEVTEMEIRMPAITSLAFGFTSFLYFMYGPFPHSDEMVIEREGLSLTKNKSPIDYVSPTEVRKTEYYDYVKNTTLELESFEKCFTAFKWKGTKMIAQSGIYDGIAKTINSSFSDGISSFENLTSYKTSGDADVLIGYFKEGKTREGYFVSNFCGYEDINYKKKNNIPFKGLDSIRYTADDLTYSKNATVSLEFKNFSRVYLIKNGQLIEDKQLIKHCLNQELKPGDYMFVIPY